MHWNEHLLLHDKPQDKGYFLLKFTCIRRTGAGFNYRHKRQFIHQLWLKLYIKATLPVQIKKLKEHFKNSKNFELQCNNTNNTNKEWKAKKKQLPTMKLKNFCQVGSSFSLFLMKFPLRKKQEPNPTLKYVSRSSQGAGWAVGVLKALVAFVRCAMCGTAHH